MSICFHSRRNPITPLRLTEIILRPARWLSGLGQSIADGRRMSIRYGAVMRTTEDRRNPDEPSNHQIVDDLRTRIADRKRDSI